MNKTFFSETISLIDHEVEWINYELGRQSTTVNQADNLKKMKKHLLSIRVLCKSYEKHKYLDINYNNTFNNEIR